MESYEIIQISHQSKHQNFISNGLNLVFQVEPSCLKLFLHILQLFFIVMILQTTQISEFSLASFAIWVNIFPLKYQMLIFCILHDLQLGFQCYDSLNNLTD